MNEHFKFYVFLGVLLAIASPQSQCMQKKQIAAQKPSLIYARIQHQEGDQHKKSDWKLYIKIEGLPEGFTSNTPFHNKKSNAYKALCDVINDYSGSENNITLYLDGWEFKSKTKITERLDELITIAESVERKENEELKTAMVNITKSNTMLLPKNPIETVQSSCNSTPKPCTTSLKKSPDNFIKLSATASEMNFFQRPVKQLPTRHIMKLNSMIQRISITSFINLMDYKTDVVKLGAILGRIGLYKTSPPLITFYKTGSLDQLN
ncbi:MAG: hypothetical protein WCE21_04025 [Candidatus Babeliales bacterium]